MEYDIPAPPTLSECCDRLYDLKLEKSLIVKQIEAIEEKEKEFKACAIQLMFDNNLTAAQGTVGALSLKQKDVPQIEDMRIFLEYCKREGREEFIKIGMDASAISAAFDGGIEDIAGIRKFRVNSLSLKKAHR